MGEPQNRPCSNCGKDRGASIFECPHCGNSAQNTLPKFENSYEDQQEFSSYQSAYLANYNKCLIFGLIIFAVGLIVTVSSWSSSGTDGPIVYAYGAMAVGLCNIIYGLIRKW